MTAKPACNTSYPSGGIRTARHDRKIKHPVRLKKPDPGALDQKKY